MKGKLWVLGCLATLLFVCSILPSIAQQEKQTELVDPKIRQLENQSKRQGPKKYQHSFWVHRRDLGVKDDPNNLPDRDRALVVAVALRVKVEVEGVNGAAEANVKIWKYTNPNPAQTKYVRDSLTPITAVGTILGNSKEGTLKRETLELHRDTITGPVVGWLTLYRGKEKGNPQHQRAVFRWNVASLDDCEGAPQDDPMEEEAFPADEEPNDALPPEMLDP